MTPDLSASSTAAPAMPADALRVISTPGAGRAMLEMLRVALRVPIVWIRFDGPADESRINAVGIDPTSVRRSHILDSSWGGAAITIVGNTQLDPRTEEDPLVVGPPNVRCLMGMPVVDALGHRIGAVVAADTALRTRPCDHELEIMERFRPLMLWAVDRRDLGALIVEQKEEITRYHQLMGVSDDFMGFATVDGRVIGVNPGGRRLVGRSEHEDLSGLMIAAFHPPAIRRMLWETAIPRAIAEGSWTGESRLLHRDGSEIIVEQTVLAHRDAAEVVTHLSTLCRDLSDQDALARMREHERMKDLFISTVSHELRTPLTSIALSLSVLSEDLGGSLSPDDRELLRIADQNAQRLGRLIDDLLELQRSDIVGGEPVLRQVMVEDLIRSVLEVMRGTLEVSEIQIRTSLDCDHTVRCDPRGVERVLVNLIGNAVKFSPNGSTIALEVEGMGDGGVMFSVIDSGIGIRDADLERVFEAFWQADSSASRAVQGSGLGLAIARQIVERHGGSIEVESRLGEGSTFRFFIPVG